MPVAAAASCVGLAAVAAAASAAQRRRSRPSAESESLRDGAHMSPTEPSNVACVDPVASGEDGADEMLAEVARRSKAVLYVVSNKTLDKFSIPNLTKYLRMKGVEVHEGSTPEETVQVNAARLLEFLEQQAAGAVGATKHAVSLRHELVRQTIPRKELEELFPAIREAYAQQTLDYGEHSRYGDSWKISCYIVVMEHWKPKIFPHEPMVRCLTPIMNRCVEAFSLWYRTRHSIASVEVLVMNAFVTRYRAVQNEDQLKKHIDGSNVDGTCILALPTDDPFEGGALHVWDGKPLQELMHRPEPGDTIFLDGRIWHQAKPITCGSRWALVLFLRVQNRQAYRGLSSPAVAGA